MIDVTIGRGNYQVVISDESGRLRKGGGEGGERVSIRAVRSVGKKDFTLDESCKYR